MKTKNNNNKTFRIYSKNITGAIKSVLPQVNVPFSLDVYMAIEKKFGEEQAQQYSGSFANVGVKTGQVHKALIEEGYTYNYTYVCIALNGMARNKTSGVRNLVSEKHGNWTFGQFYMVKD